MRLNLCQSYPYRLKPLLIRQLIETRIRLQCQLFGLSDGLNRVLIIDRGDIKCAVLGAPEERMPYAVVKGNDGVHIVQDFPDAL